MSVQVQGQRAPLHPVLRRLFNELGREGAAPVGRATRIEFLADDAYVVANIKDGESRVCILAYLLSGETERSDEEVRTWVEQQPPAASGVLEAFIHEEEGTRTILPRLVFERPVEGFTANQLREDIRRFAEAWEARAVASALPVAPFGMGGVGDPVVCSPQNAWLLMGDSASFPSDEELNKMRADGLVGVYDNCRTGPKNGELDDLALLYFVAPRRAACFVARFASRPFWTDESDVNAESDVDRHQWWVYISPLIEINPIPYKTLQEAAGGFLPLRGRSGRYLGPQIIRELRFVARHPEQQDELDRVVQAPVGLTKLPRADETSFDRWRRIPSGLLPLEAKVSEHVVVPLARFLSEVPRNELAEGSLVPSSEASLDAIPVPEVRVEGGYVDFVFECDGVPALAVEVKLAILRPVSGVWADSPDFLQLRRYMSALDVPGLLVDAQRLLLVRRGADAPFAEIIRSEATEEDIILIRGLMQESGQGAGGAPVHGLGAERGQRFVVALGASPMNSPDSDHATDDLCVVIADGFNSPIRSVESIGNQEGYDLIKSYHEDDPSLTPRQAVGILGMQGMYRLEAG